MRWCYERKDPAPDLAPKRCVHEELASPHAEWHGTKRSVLLGNPNFCEHNIEIGRV